MNEHSLAFWQGRLQEISLALERARCGPLPPNIANDLDIAFYAVNRAQAQLCEEEMKLEERPKRKARARGARRG